MGMSSELRTSTLPLGRQFALIMSVLVLATTLTWVYLSMRAIMDIGGSCASGGPYVIETPCPDGAATLLSVGIPVMVLSTFAASGLALGLKAPALLLPMWNILFGSLGWNFLDYGVSAPDGSGPVVGWIVCGSMCELMALGGLALMISTRTMESAEGATVTGRQWWWSSYLILGLAGLVLGMWSFNAWT